MHRIRSASRVAEVPRTIYSLWLQGLEDAPAIVRLNFERWTRLNPGYRMEILDQVAVAELLSDVPLKVDNLSPQALSDVVRACLLARNGGVWVDASVFPARPLDEWLPAHINSSGFFAFERPGPDRPLSSWFIAATADNPIMRAWWEEVLNYWSAERLLRKGIPDNPVEAVATWTDTYPYFWFHYLFQLLVDRDPDLGRAWAACVKVSADAPHVMQGRLAQDPRIELDELRAIAALAPVHKLNWRAPYPAEKLSLIN
jgi:hypothetical protein